MSKTAPIMSVSVWPMYMKILRIDPLAREQLQRITEPEEVAYEVARITIWNLEQGVEIDDQALIANVLKYLSTEENRDERLRDR